MKEKCLVDFYKSLEEEVSVDFSASIKQLIDEDNLKEDQISELIEKEAEK